MIANINHYFRCLIILSAILHFTTLSQAAVTLSITGGTGGTPLVATITLGDTFTATESYSSNLFIVFKSIFDNSAASTAAGTTGTASLAGTTFNGTSGAINNALLDHGDLILEVLTSSVTSGVPFSVTTGTVTTGNLNLNYTSLVGEGSIIFLKSTSSQLSGASGTYIAIPEPSRFASVMGLCLIGLAIAFRCWQQAKLILIS